ncbi:alpha-L-rhamnosidase C-terminal domain-containing protein [Erysipelatoclostridium sp. An173]|uniref:alpha-L-rhamnosidase C-terminal domain-containing protein n=1 Tax=Erysipelatoclostridium sp. An173 TaxID=1965571 RepID=UPI001EF4DDE1|nr:alpha-L-rhamnosidase C-terminal domain-containing protein [Erysipelatoclostridium sp. An173]
MYRELGGLQIIEPSYKKFKVAPALDCGLEFVSIQENSPYGKIKVDWQRIKNQIIVHVTVPVNTTADIVLSNFVKKDVGSGNYTFVITI